MRHLQRRRGMLAKATGGRQQAAVVPSRSAHCPRYITTRQIYAGMDELPSAENRLVCRNRLPVNANAASRLPDKSKGAKKPGVHNRIDLSPQNTKKPTQFQLTQRPTRTNLVWHIVYSLAGRQRQVS
ncbi:hypothetical protein ASPCAL14879 [Aspergillus calidoustus]|uniref:Uncharacterized protein n=1 Tax=Aspergillus calidoustus TaxID=454130 RepID=A0A0U5GK35_ASPCI|nr:hypothetical protein ASPCAL14879 [Aspergillus calidoustus]